MPSRDYGALLNLQTDSAYYKCRADIILNPPDDGRALTK